MRGKAIRSNADRDQEKYKFSFASLNIVEIDSQGLAGVVRGNSVVAQGVILDRLRSVASAPMTKGFDFASLRPGREGSASIDPMRTSVMPVILRK